MDVLSDVLAVMRSGTPRSALTSWQPPWVQEFPPVAGAVGFHLVVHGTCALLLDGSEPVVLGPGDLVLRPHGNAHLLADTPPHQSGRMQVPRPAGGMLLCGAYEMDADLVHPLFRDLPQVIHIPAAAHNHPRLQATAELLTAELRQPGPGTQALVPALLDTLLVYVLREILDRTAEQTTGWPAAVHDPGIAAALRAVHTEPARYWTVAALADQARMSRATFARRFTGLIGQPPVGYLTWWRLTTAARLLRTSDAPLDEVAAGVGYTSTFAFSNAFKRRFGVAPGQYRRAGADPYVRPSANE